MYIHTYIHNTEFWWENMKQRDRLEDLDVDEDNIKMDLKEVG
jgi:alcohol dehydrogenase YqhD (iron-dependent ADH family)